MAPAKLDRARRSILVRPRVRSAEAHVRLAASLRRLGVDEKAVTKLVGATASRVRTS